MKEAWKELRRSILERDNFRCQFCGLGGKTSDIILEIDHILEKSKGGSDDPSNLRVLCQKCHMIRHNKTPRVDGTFTSRRERKKERKKRGR
jgi:5-methylcytosine-specific restriction protein A